MKLRRSFIVIVIATAIIVLALHTVRDSPPSVEKTKSAPISPPERMPDHNNPLTVAGDFDWEDVSADKIEEFLNYYEPSALEEGFEMNADVSMGDTIITSPYEALPGELVFTKITLIKPETDKYGKWIKARFNTFTIDLSGNERPVSYSPKSMDAQIPANGAPFSIGIGRDGGKYEIKMRAISSDPSAISLEMEGGFHKE